MLTNILLYWSLLEFLNWINYIFIYFKLLKKNKLVLNKKQINNLIFGIKNSSSDEIEKIIKTSISYEKNNLIKKNNDNLEISSLSLIEINNIIKKYILYNKFENKIDEIREIIESKLDINFEDNNNNRYIINEWGNNFIYFSFIPLFLSLFFKIIFNSIHYYMIYFLKLNYKVIENNSLGILYNQNDPNKKTLLFIHGFGFGYFPYINSLIKLSKNYNIIILILPNISSYLYSKDISLDHLKIIDYLYDFIEKHEYKKIIMMAHSFGTFISHIIMKNKRSKIIQKNIVIDPTYFFIDYTKIQKHAEFPCYNKKNIIFYLIDSFVNYLIYDSIYLKNVCYRYLCGPKYWIYDSNNLKKHIFIFHKHDYVVNAELTYEKIKNNNESYLIETENASHGTILFDSKLYYKLIEIIEK
jgi:hypothetical protein